MADDFEKDELPLSRLDPRPAASLEFQGQDADARRLDATSAHTPANPPQSRSRHLYYLDGLRGFAAMMVYMVHHQAWYMAGTAVFGGFGAQAGTYYFTNLPFIRVLFDGGGPAVAVFFVLSGYVLSRSPLGKLDSGSKLYKTLVAAVLRRPIRLFLPVVAISLPFAILMQLSIIRPVFNWQDPYPNMFLALKDWFVEMLAAVNPFTEHYPQKQAWFKYDPVVWTMALELRGSLLVYGITALAAYLHTTAIRRLALFAGLGVFLLFIGQWHMSCFMAGMVFAQNDIDGEGHDMAFLKRLTPRSRSLFLHGLLVFALYLCSQTSGADDPSWAEKTPGFYYLTKLTPPNYYKGTSWEYFRFWTAIGSAIIIYCTLRLRWMQRLFDRMRYIGRISFALYLIHVPILWCFGGRVYAFFGLSTEATLANATWDNWVVVPAWGPQGLDLRFLAAHVIILPLTIALSHLFTVWVDEPTVRLSKKFSTWALPKGWS